MESLGINVKGERISDPTLELNSNSDSSDSDIDVSNENYPINERICNSNVSELSTKNISNITKINLDVSAMLAYCSSVTNGSANLFDFNVPVLKQQAEWERLRPQKPLLDAFFNGRIYLQ